MSELASFEQRLIAALDRIDYSLDMSARQGDAPATQDAADGDAQTTALRAENADLRKRLEEAVATLPDFSAATMNATAPKAEADALSQTEARLSQAMRESARLAASNEQLIAANRALMQAMTGDDKLDALRQALDAEAEALRAARAAEVAQMGDVLVALEQLLSRRKADSDAPRPGDDAPADAVLPDVTAPVQPDADSQKD